jgi:hypothetical protein
MTLLKPKKRRGTGWQENLQYMVHRFYSCDFCGKTFRRGRSHMTGSHHFCSRSCASKYRHKREKDALVTDKR